LAGDESEEVFTEGAGPSQNCTDEEKIMSTRVQSMRQGSNTDSQGSFTLENK